MPQLRPITIIPAVDIMDGQVVRLYRGDPGRRTTYGSDPVKTALEWQAQGADMLHVVDLDATLGRGSNHDIVRRITDAVSIPVQVAGGLRSVQAALDAAQAADRIVIGTMAFSDEISLEQILDDIGRDRVIVSADHTDGIIVIRGWQDQTTLAVASEVRRMYNTFGISEFLITNVGRDGTLQGPDIKHLEQSCTISNHINVIASGGISAIRDIPAVAAAGAWGVILGRAIYDGKMTIRDAKEAACQYVKNHNNAGEAEPQRH